jgi:hypothetical protein
MYLHLGIDLGQSTKKAERLREKLGVKAKQEKNFKFYSLYGHICNMNVLKVAWKGVRNHLQKRSQRHYKPPEGVSYYKHINKLGLIYL